MPRIAKNIKNRAHRLCSGCENVPDGAAKCPACGRLAVHDWNDKPQSFWQRHTNIICCDHCQVAITCTIVYGRGTTLALAAPGPAPDAAVFGPAWLTFRTSGTSRSGKITVNPIREIDHEARTVREVRVFVRQYIWPGGASSYDVHLADGQSFHDKDGEPQDCLTMGGSFDHMPADGEIERLPYLRPSVRQEAPGVFYILTGPYQKGPYPSRKTANADIRAGRW